MAEAGPKLLRGLLEVFVLEELERAPRHGYALLREAAQTFGATPNRNRLYPLLARLVADGLVEEIEDGDEGKATYALTDAGRSELEAYRAMPAPFREAIARLWGSQTEVHLQGPVMVPQPGRAPAVGSLPYPCPDARVSVERAPASGSLTVRVTGCPIGTYSYCPLCPMSKALAQLSMLTLGS